MKLLLLTLCMACATADVSHIVGGGHSDKDVHAKIVAQELDLSPDGNYVWSYKTENDISADEQGTLKNVGEEGVVITVQGQASWIADDGTPVQLQYIADENGYQPQGSHIPTPPPIPEAILRSLQYIRDHPPPPEKP